MAEFSEKMKHLRTSKTGTRMGSVEPSRSQEDGQGSREGVKSQMVDQTQLSQTLHTCMAKVQALEANNLQMEKENKDLLETCERQEQNIYDLQCNIDQIDQQIVTEQKQRESFDAKLMEVTKVSEGVFNNCNALTASLHQVAAVGEDAKLFVNGLKQKFETMQASMYQLTSVDVPCYIKFLQNAVEERKHKNQYLREKQKRQLDAVQEQQRNESSSLCKHIDEKATISSALHLQIASEKEELALVCSEIERLSKEKFEEIETLKEQLKDWTQKRDSAVKELDILDTVLSAAAAQFKGLDSDLFEAKAREESLKCEVVINKENVHCLTKELSEKKEQQNDVEYQISNLEEDIGQTRKELEEFRGKLQDVENDTRKQASDLQDELSKLTTMFATREKALLESINKTKEEDKNYKMEAELMKLELLQIEEETQDNTEQYKIMLESIKYLETQLGNTENETENLRVQIAELEEVLSVEKATVATKQLLSAQMNEKSHEITKEFEQQIASLKLEENKILEELASVESDEQKLLHEIQVLQEDQQSFCSVLTEKNEKMVRDLQKESLLLEEEIQSICLTGEKSTSDINQKVVQVRNDLEEKETELNNLNTLISLRTEEQDVLTKNINNLSMEIQERSVANNKLKEKISCLNTELEMKKKHNQELNQMQEQEASKINEKNTKIAELLSKFENDKVEFSKLELDNEKEKQVFQRELVKFQKNCEYRQEDIKSFQKQISTLNESIATTTNKINDLKSEVESHEQQAKDKEAHLREINLELQRWKANVLIADREAKKHAEQQSHIKKKVDVLNEKIRLLREAKKVKPDTTQGLFRKPSNVQSTKVRTCQSSALSEDKENKNDVMTATNVLTSALNPSPKPVLKNPSAMSSRPVNSVSFTLNDSYDEVASQSSGSTIVLEPSFVDEISRNPAVFRQIFERRRERQASKRMNPAGIALIPPEDQPTPSKRMLPENEISSSTPENETSHRTHQLD